MHLLQLPSIANIFWYMYAIVIVMMLIGHNIAHNTNRVYNKHRTAAHRWRIALFFIILLQCLHPHVAKTLNDDNDDDISIQTICPSDESCNDQTMIQQLKQQHKLTLQRREHDLKEMQRELQIQLNQILKEKEQLEMNDDNMERGEATIEYEIPSYCANCLGDIYEPPGYSSLSSEYARKNLNKDKSGILTEESIDQLSDTKRLEAIKQQILLKLGLKTKPNITSNIPRQFVYETLQRTGDPTFDFNDNRMLLQTLERSNDPIMDQLQQLKMHNDFRNSSESMNDDEVPKETSEDESEFDDFYGRTREIIMFAERGQLLNGHHLLEFSTSSDNQTRVDASKLKIRMASLWIMVGEKPKAMVNDQQQQHVKPNYNDDDTVVNRRRSRHSNNKLNQNYQHHHVNTLLFKNIHNQNRKKKKKRKRKDNSPASASNLFYNDNHNYNNHITNYNNNSNGYHIIKNNSYIDKSQKNNKFTASNIRHHQHNNYNKFNNNNYNNYNNNNYTSYSISNNEMNFTSNIYDNTQTTRNVTLWIFQMRQPFDRHQNAAQFLDDKEFDKMTEFSASKQIQLNQLGWQKINVTSIIQSWYQRSGDNDLLQLYIDCSGCGDRFQVHLLSPQTPHKSSTIDQRQQQKSAHVEHDGPKTIESNNDYINDVNRPFLVVNIEPSIMRRSRRRALDCSNAPGSQCCKERFYVSFQRLGWDDWIIAPQGYYANYCRGDCGNGLHRTPDTFLTYYSHVFHEVRKYNKLNGNQLCCAPLKFSSMSLIYFGPDSKIIKRDLPKMVVDECGCP